MSQIFKKNTDLESDLDIPEVPWVNDIPDATVPRSPKSSLIIGVDPITGEVGKPAACEDCEA